MMNLEDIKTAYNLDLKPYNTLRISSFANKVYFPKNEDELKFVLNNEKDAIIIGGGSNIIFSSNGVSTPLVFLQELNKIEIKDNFLYVQSGVKSPKLAQYAKDNSISGFEFLIGIPSSIGGNIFMNAGANNQAISDNLISVCVLNKEKNQIEEILKKDCDFKYRSSLFKKNPSKFVILGAKFEIKKGNKEEIELKIDENKKKREETQPYLKFPNAGSTFINPENQSAGCLLDKCNLKGVSVGGASVYNRHANFIINNDNAISRDILSLMLKMQDCVYNKFKIKLESELLFIGDKDKTEEELWKKITSK